MGIKCILIVKKTHKGAMLKKTNSKENIVNNSEKETFSSFGLTNFSILFRALREVEPFGTTLNSMKFQPGSQTTKKVRCYFFSTLDRVPNKRAVRLFISKRCSLLTRSY